MSESQPFIKTLYKTIIDWLKANGGDFIITKIMEYGGSFLAANAKGFYGWVLKLVFKYVVIPFLKHAIQHIKNERDAKEKLDKLNEVLNDPTKTNADVILAEDDFFTRPK